MSTRLSGLGSGGSSRLSRAANRVAPLPEPSRSPVRSGKDVAKLLATPNRRGTLARTTLDGKPPPGFRRVAETTGAGNPPKCFEDFYQRISNGSHEDASDSFLQTKMNASVNPRGFVEESAKLRSRLRKTNKLLLDPYSKWMTRWDMFMLLLLVYTAIVTPYEVCMLWEATKMDTLFGLNWAVNICFIGDMVANFFMPYRETPARGGHITKDHRKIARHYLRTWFPIDLVSVIPIDTILMLAGASDYLLVESGGGDLLKLVRMLRLLRLIKLARILRASRIFARWETKISISYDTRELLKWMVYVATLLHWLACAYGMVAQIQGTLRTDALESAISTKMGTDPTCYGCVRTAAEISQGTRGGSRWCNSATINQCLTPCELDTLAWQRLVDGGISSPFADEVAAQKVLLREQEMWVCRYYNAGLISGNADGDMYVAALYVAVLMLGGGLGKQAPTHLAEYIFFLVGTLLGSVTWAMVVGTICGMMATGDPHTIEYRQQMDALNFFLRDMHVPEDLALEARSYLNSTRELHKKLSYNVLMRRLSPGLCGRMTSELCSSTINRVWYLHDCESEVLTQLAMKLDFAGYPPRERIDASTRINVLMRGIAAKGGSILYGGACWGVDMIVSSPLLRDTRHCTALTYVEVAMLSRDDLYEVLNRPQNASSLAVVRNAAVRIAMKRVVVLLKAYADRRRAADKVAAAAARARNESARQGGADVDDDDDQTSAAYDMLTAAFSGDMDGGAPQGADDPGMIFRLITGAKGMRDIDADGCLLEQDDGAGGASESAAVRTELSALRTEVSSIKAGMGEMRTMLRQLLDAKA